MFTLNCKGRLLSLDEPKVMGIINVTPDSFYSGSRHRDSEAIRSTAAKMLADGADIIDVGAQSTRPHAELLPLEEELARITGIVEMLSASFPEAVISVDTFYSEVALECVQAGASMVNDVSGGNMDELMLQIVGGLNVPYICMHMKGTPQTMTQHARYDNIVLELLHYFTQKIGACTEAGIKDVIIDPGFGFSKNRQQNLALLSKIGELKITGRPLMVGLSRKSTITGTLGISAADALNGTTVLHTIALLNGAKILRAHDVKEAKECIRLYQAYHEAATQAS